jgi:DNA-binding protein HU-alpha
MTGEDETKALTQGAARGKGKPAGPVVVKAKPNRARALLRKKDFVDQTAERAGGKKAEVKSTLDAALAVLAEALAAGKEVVLPPLGKIKVMREKDSGKAKVLVLRLQVMAEGDDGAAPLADKEHSG